MQTTVDFLRHGDVAEGSYYRGSTNDPLTTKGWQQMQIAVADRNWDQIICSPLHRCLDFSQQLYEQTKTPVYIEPNWQEIDFGDWEGKTAEQINQGELMRFYQDPINNSPTNAEPYKIFQSRIELAWKNLLKAYSGKHVLVVTHGGVIRCLFPLLLKLPLEKIFHLQVDHASLTRFQCTHDSGDDFISLIFHNLTDSNLY